MISGLQLVLVRCGFVVGFVSLCLSGKIVLTIRSRKRVLSDLAIKKESIGCPSKKESIGW